MIVVGFSLDGNIYVLDAIRDRLNLTQRTEKVFMFHRVYRPLKTGYEQYGLQADIEHLRYVQQERQYRFAITELGGSTPKPDRIKKLIPDFEEGRLWLPRRLKFPGADGKTHDWVREFIEDQFVTFPVGRHEDDLDCLARIKDPVLNCQFPEGNRARRDDYGNEIKQKPSRANSAYEVLP